MYVVLIVTVAVEGSLVNSVLKNVCDCNVCVLSHHTIITGRLRDTDGEVDAGKSAAAAIRPTPMCTCFCLFFVFIESNYRTVSVSDCCYKNLTSGNTNTRTKYVSQREHLRIHNLCVGKLKASHLRVPACS